MCELTRALRQMERPALLVRAARCGVPDYERKRDLRRLTRVAVPKSSRRALTSLLALEERVEHRRVTGDANYSMTRHVDLLIAVMAEAQLMEPA